MKKKKTDSYIFTVGRRKRSVARIRLFHGKGQTLVNNLPLEEYFKPVPVARLLEPLRLTKTEGKYYVTAKIAGGGKSGQLGAFIHGLSRALVREDSPGFRAVLKSAGLLTRDPREKERRKYGLAQSARAKKQSPKR